MQMTRCLKSIGRPDCNQYYEEDWKQEFVLLFIFMYCRRTAKSDLCRRVRSTTSVPNLSTSGSESEDTLPRRRRSARMRKLKLSSSSCEVAPKNTIIIEEEAQQGSVCNFIIPRLLKYGVWGGGYCNHCFRFRPSFCPSVCPDCIFSLALDLYSEL